MHFFCGIVQIFDINIIFNEIGVPSEQESPKIGAAGLVAGPPSLICGELHHPSGLQGKWFVRCRIGFYANLIKVSQAQATSAGVPEHWNALSEAGILEG